MWRVFLSFLSAPALIIQFRFHVASGLQPGRSTKHVLGQVGRSTQALTNTSPSRIISFADQVETTQLSRSSSCLWSSTSSSTDTPFDSKYYSPPEETTRFSNSGGENAAPRVTLSRFLSNMVKENPELKDLQSIYLALELSCKTISNLVNRAGLVYSIDAKIGDGIDGDDGDNYSDGRYYSMKRLDRLSTNVLKNALKFTGTVKMIAPNAKVDGEKPDQHQPGVLIAYDDNYVACLDPLDGSGNADASICTGTIFGVFNRKRKGEDRGNITEEEIQSNVQPSEETEEDLLESVLQPASNMRAAGYCLYSSATVLVFTLADHGVYGFTLDPQIQEFVLTHDNLTIPPRGNVYSCNEANSEGWNQPWKDYLKQLKLGHGQTQTRYAHRYVGSMVGDIHRTLLYGGIFAYPSDRIQKPKGNLQLLYKSAPMAFVVHHAGGKAMDEDGLDLLDKRPKRIHQKTPCFMGSPQDVDELKGYLVKGKNSADAGETTKQET